MKICVLIISAITLIFSSLPRNIEKVYIDAVEKPLTNENIDAFINAQNILDNDAYVKNYNDKSANIIVTDSYGKQMLYNFDYLNNRVNSVSKVFNSTSSSNKLVKKANTLVEPTTTNNYLYDDEGRLVSVVRPNSTMNLTYSDTGLLLNQSVNGNSIVANKLVTENLISEKVYGNGLVTSNLYNSNNQLIEVKENGNLIGKYTYNNLNQVTSFTDLKTNISYNYLYIDNNLVSSISSDGTEITYVYDENNESIKERQYFVRGENITTSQTENGIISSDFSMDIVKDISDRPIYINMNVGDSFDFIERFHYVEFEPTYDQLKEETYEDVLENKSSDYRIKFYNNNYLAIEYEYDNAGNLIVEKKNDGNEINYLYDQNGQLIEFVNQKDNEYYLYDENGNVVSINGKKLFYDTSSGLDLLVGYLDYYFKYDSIGNPIVYKNHKLNWNGKTLTNYDGNCYSYNLSGIRTSKRLDDGRIINYVLEGDKVIAEYSNYNGNILYHYSSNEVVGLQYRGKDYFYIKNPQNDILGIFDSNGEIVVKYEYSPWGKILGITGPLANTLGIDNPYRFKSYRYDNETGLYYLNSRYYDPEIGRFISPDDLQNLQYTILNDNYSKNLYMYAFNNPVNKYDPNGNMAVGVLNALKLLYSDLRIVPDYAISTPCLVFNATNLYKGFHETAQLVAAKQLSKKGYVTELEYLISGNTRADILAYRGVNYLYEVKPITYSHNQAYNQLKGYLSKTGYSYGPYFTTAKIDFLPYLEMKVEYESQGIIKYSFWKDKWQWFNKWVKVEIMESNLINKLLIGFWVGVAIAGAVIAATVIEDVLTAGAGVADDAASIGVASAGFRGAVAFGLLFV